MKISKTGTLIIVLSILCVAFCSAFSLGVSAEDSRSVQLGLELALVSDNEIDIGVVLTSNFEVTNGSFNLYYDREVFEFVADNGKTAMLEKALYEFNPDYTDAEGNKALRVSFASAYALPSENGVIFSARFKMLRSGETNLSVKYGKIYDNSTIPQRYYSENVSLPVFLGNLGEVLNVVPASRYTVDDDFIAGISPNTKVKDLKSNFTNKCIKVIGADGKEITDDALVGTGCEVRLCTANGECATGVAYANIILKTFKTILKGDVDGNGKIDSTDTILLKRHMLKIASLTGVYLVAADSDSNNKIDATDYLFVKRVILGIVNI